MKLTTFILIVALGQVSAKSLAQKITLNTKNTPIEKVLQSIRDQSGYEFLYDLNDIKNHKVTVSLINGSVDEAMKQLVRDLPLTYQIVKNNVVLGRKKPSFLDQVIDRFANIDVHGRVLDEENKPLSGAKVKVKGSNQSTVTDQKGEFYLPSVSDKEVLVITYIGYVQRELKAAQNIGDVLLSLSDNKLEEVNVTVNTGYQTLSKERSAGSFAKPDMSIVKNRSTSMNILQRLDGLIPGLTVNNSPKSSENPFLIRGLSTIGVKDEWGNEIGSNRNPLYVVDGIAIDNVSSINPQDVADITVLKDATAASIWGARASNGVIVITTKKGTPNAKVKVTCDGFVNFQGKPDLGYLPRMTSKEFIEAAKEVYTKEYTRLNPWSTVTGFIGGNGLAPHEVILYNEHRGIVSEAQANKSLDSLAGINNRQQIKDLFYRNAALTNHTISLSGGGKMYSFYGSTAYTGTISSTPGEKDNSYKVNLRQDLTLTNWVKVYLITDLTNTITSAGKQSNIDYSFNPYQLFRGSKGEHLSVPYMGMLSDSTRIAMENRSKVNLDYVPLDEVNYGHTKSDGLMNRITGGMQINLFKGLRFEGVYGYIHGTNRTTNYDDAKSYARRSELVQFTVAPTENSIPKYYLPTTGGDYSVANLTQRNWTVRNQLVYDNAWSSDLHQLTLLAGQEAQEQLTISNTSLVKGYDEKLQTYALLDYQSLRTIGVKSPLMPNNQGISLLAAKPFYQSERMLRFTSYYANASYTYARKYSFNGSWRIDRSNLFGLDNSAQNKPVWSAGAKWSIGEEDFLAGSARWINHLALRATYGISGNSPMPGVASSHDVLEGLSSEVFPSGKGLSVATAANPKLTWETTNTLNFGIDFSLLDNRLSGAVDFYDKKTDNLIGNMNVNSFTGYSSIIGNYGSLRNKGVEFSINSVNITKLNFSWSTFLSLAYNKNTITQLNSPIAIATGGQLVGAQYVTGFPAFAVFAYNFAGLDGIGDPQIYLNDHTVTKDPRYVTRPEDILFMGTYQPVWSGGLSNVFQYKDFTLSANVSFNLGHVMRVIGGSSFPNPNFLNRWRKPGDEEFTNIPSYEVNSALSLSRRNIEYYSAGNINVASASYIKLRDITLAYSLPKSLLRHVRTENISLRAQVSNLMLWKANHQGIDPEFDYSTPFGQGMVTLGASVKF